jgi:hypothetical protein
MDNPEDFPSLPLRSACPPTVVPSPENIAVTKATGSLGTMNQVPSSMPSSQSSPTQPTTSSPSVVLNPVSSPAVTNIESDQTPSPLLLQKRDTQRNLVADGSVVGRKQGLSARSSYSRSSKIPHSSRRGISEGAGSSEETIIQARGEQARALAEGKVKAQAAQAEQQHIKEVQEKQLAIKRRGIELQLEGRRKEAKRGVEREAEEAKIRPEGRRKEAEREAVEDKIRAEQELLALQNDQLQAQSES